MAVYTDQQLGHYRLLRSLGRGASAEVYLGQHIHLGTFVAIKVLSGLVEGCRSDDFRCEAQIIAHLRHPHIVRVLDFGVENNLPFLVMDYVPNGTLRQRYPHGTILPLSAIVTYTKQIAQALQYAHDHKITHRDVKPENMLLDKDDRVLLSDFGISAIEHTTSPLTTLKRVSTGQAGTPIYMAPEHIQGNPHFASDQYALAVVVYEWLCGARPFSGDMLAVLYQHVHTQPPSLRETLATISPGIEQVILKALVKDPQQRYATILDFAQALEEAVQMDVGLTFLRRLPSASVSPQLIAAAPIQPTVFLPESDSAMCARPRPAPVKSIRLAQQRHGPAPHWMVLLLGLVCILIAGSFAFYTVALLRTTATPSPLTPAQATVIGSVKAYNGAVKNGIMDGFDAQHTRVNPYEKIITPATVPQLNVAWKAPAGGKIWSAATVANNLVYISSCPTGTLSGQMFALRAKTRAVVWSNNNGSCDFGNAPAYANGFVYMGAPDHYLYAYDASTGKVLWKALTRGSIGSSPTLANGVIYIGSDDGKLYAIDASTGKQLWQYQTENYIRSSPAIANGIVYVGSDDGKLYAIDASTGKQLWQYQTRGKIDSSPAVANGIVYVGSLDNKLYAFNALCKMPCQPRWSDTTEGGIASSPAVYNGVVYAGSLDHMLYAFDAVHGHRLGTATTGDSIRSSPTIADGVLFIGSDDGSLYAYDVTRCGGLSCQPQSLWNYPTPAGRKVVSSPVAANGYVYVGSDDGYLYAFDIGGV